MGRPKIKADKKKVQVSISVPKAVADLASKTENASHFYSTSVQCANALAQAIADLRASRKALADVIEDLEDAAAIWNAEFEESIPFDEAFPKKAPAKAERPAAPKRKAG